MTPFLALVLAGFATFIGVLAGASAWSRRRLPARDILRQLTPFPNED